jgi:hypothetical protein
MNLFLLAPLIIFSVPILFIVAIIVSVVRGNPKKNVLPQDNTLLTHSSDSGNTIPLSIPPETYTQYTDSSVMPQPQIEPIHTHYDTPSTHTDYTATSVSYADTTPPPSIDVPAGTCGGE